MNAGESMDASVLMQKLMEKEINTSLLIEFYEEVVDNEKVFAEMVEEISSDREIEERRKSLEHIERFCVILRQLREQHHDLIHSELIFSSNTSRRERMINNASRFIEMLEKDCNLKFPQ